MAKDYIPVGDVTARGQRTREIPLEAIERMKENWDPT